MSYAYIEPDFNQQGDLTIRLIGRANARSNFRTVETTVPAIPTGEQQVSKVKYTARLTAFEIESNTVDGYFECGAPVFHWRPGDGRIEDGGDQPTDVDTAASIETAP